MTQFGCDILDSGAESFNRRYNFIFRHGKSFRPVPQFILCMDVDARYFGRPSLLGHLMYQVLGQSKEAAPMPQPTRPLITRSPGVEECRRVMIVRATSRPGFRGNGNTFFVQLYNLVCSSVTHAAGH
jgi:hypothetical protein